MSLDITYQDILEALEDPHILRKYTVYHRRILFEHDKNYQVVPSDRDYLHALSFQDKFIAFYKLNYFKLGADRIMRVKDTPFPRKMKEELGLYYLLKVDHAPSRVMYYKDKKMIFRNAGLIWDSHNLEMLCVVYS